MYFFVNDTATTEIYTLSLHDALPICLTMAANELTCLYLLPILHEYRRLYPEVHITVQRALGSRVPAQVLDYGADFGRSEEHTSELQSQSNLVCRLLLEKKK